jgi:hypothetical protein
VQGDQYPNDNTASVTPTVQTIALNIMFRGLRRQLAFAFKIPPSNSIAVFFSVQARP